MCAVGVGYVAIYHQTTQQISAHTQTRFKNCHGHEHKGGTNDRLHLPALPANPPLLFQEPHADPQNRYSSWKM